jgi:putative transcriptional regulator
MQSLKGHFLVAGPKLLDPNFARTVVLMIEHTEEGAAGVVINRPTAALVSEVAEAVLDEAIAWEKPIHVGGPVPGPLIVVHGREELGDLPILPGLWSTADADRLRTLVREEVEPSLVIANYSGWGPGQLENELAEESWLTAPAEVEQVFWAGDEPLWDVLARSIRGKLLAEMLHLKDLPADPNLN